MDFEMDNPDRDEHEPTPGVAQRGNAAVFPIRGHWFGQTGCEERTVFNRADASSAEERGGQPHVVDMSGLC